MRVDDIRIPTITDVLLAAKAISGKVRHTPLELSYSLSAQTGATVYLKLESQQHANSFKIRGAMNKMLALGPEELGRGVVTASSGNHAQGLATAAAMLRVNAVICVPEICPETKKASVLARGGQYVELRVVGAQYDETEAEAFRIAEREGRVFVSAYEDTWIAAGQGTVALEMLADEPELDLILCPLSGGGLMAGVTVAARALRPDIELYGTLAGRNPSWAEAFKEGRVVPVREEDSIADALGGGASALLFPFIHRKINGILLMFEEEIERAIAYVHRHNHLVIEGAAATAVAALLSGRVDIVGKRVGVVISGGNIDEDKLLTILDKYR